MGIKITRKGDSFTVETDHPGGSTDQKRLQSDTRLKAAMNNYRVDKLETSGEDSFAVHSEFDKEYKKKTGKEDGYTWF